MNIAVYSPNFHPLTGGLENAVLDLATEFERQGHPTTVITLTPADAPDAFPFRVLRRPGFFQQVMAMRRADVVLMFNVSLKGVLPWLFSGRPLMVSHQTPNTGDRRGRLKTWVANRLATRNIGCSTYMSRQFAHAVTVPNPYNDSIFRSTEAWVFRKRDIVFVGRLVSDKGADVLLNALALLGADGHRPGLTIIGAGPEEEALRRQTHELGLDGQVVFAGLKKGAELATMLNEHRYMVVPSVWAEPFGIVVLEGLACGCIVIGSQGGGLPEAMGDFGLTFPNGDVRALALRLKMALEKTVKYLPEPEKLAEHLRKHERGTVTKAYLKIFIFHTHRDPKYWVER